MKILAVVIMICMSMIASASHFVMLDAMLFTNKPDTKQYGFEPLDNMGNVYKFWSGDINGDPDEVLTKQTAAGASTNINYINIEHLPSRYQNTIQEQEDSLIKLVNVFKWIHQANPHVRVGIYSIIPQREYWRVPNRQWEHRNNLYKELGDEVDVIFPSLYTFYDDQQGWVEYAKKNIKEARKYGKPVYAFIWPQYHDSNATLGGQYIPGDYWRLQLDTLADIADGIVIWGGWQEDWATSTSETDPDNWWYQTLDFMQSLP